jgi:WD40 repeat protein
MVLKGHTDAVFYLALSADSRIAISGSRDNTLRLWNLETGECLYHFFSLGLDGLDIHWNRGMIVTGSSSGLVEFYNIENLGLGPFISTARREVISEDLPAGPVTARPPCCGQLISIPSTIADRIDHWTLEGGEGGYTDSALLLDCPSCATPLRINPFFVDIPPCQLI